MSLESPFRYRLLRNVPAILTLFAVAVTVLGGAISTAEAKQSNLPLLYKGNGYKFKPGLMYGWDPDGFGKPLRYFGKIHISDPRGTAVKWSSWGRKRAVGVGLARSSGCGTGGMRGKCEIGYPWNGTRLRVVAWRPRGGHFTRMKMRTLVPRTSARYYKLVLAFRGPVGTFRTVSWKTVRTTRG